MRNFFNKNLSARLESSLYLPSNHSLSQQPRPLGNWLLASSVCFFLGCSGGEEPASKTEPYQPPARADLISAVNPMIGTGGLGFGAGSAYPGPALPFAMIHPGPDTNTRNFDGMAFYHCAGYRYGDPLIEGFSLTHAHGTGVPDYGTFALMPLALSEAEELSDSIRSEPGYAAEYGNEQAELGYYSVELAGGRRVQITATERAAIFRFEFPANSRPVVLLDAEHTIGTGESGGGSVDISGKALNAKLHNRGNLSSRFGGFEVFAAGEFNLEPIRSGVWDESGLRPDEPSAEGVDVGAWLEFPHGTTEVELRVAISFVDAEGAQKNLAQELPQFDFEGVRSRAVEAWEPILSDFELYTEDPRETEIIATAIYHAYLMPSLMSDVDLRTRAVGSDAEPLGSVFAAEEPHYSDFSLWDTYRTLHPWVILAHPEYAGLFARSLHRMGEQGGAIPRWALANGDVHSMIGSPGEIVLAESALKGIEFDQDGAYALSLATSKGPAKGRMGGRGSIEPYLEYGYVPSDLSSGSVSHTLEYATADFAMASWAKLRGDEAEFNRLSKQANSWRALYHEESGFLIGKRSDGAWDGQAAPTLHHDQYVEGNAWHYLWMVAHDPAGLAEQLGGQERAIERLREFFELSRAEQPIMGVRNYYWHSNEPNINAPWLAAAWGDTELSRAFVNWVADELYGTGPDGIPGNDDAGTLSAWLLFASIGLYPVSGSDQYIVGAPRYPKVVLKRPGGDLTVECNADPRSNKRLERVLLDGEELSAPYISHAQLVGARILRFEFAE